MEGLDQRASYHRLVTQAQERSYPKPARLLLVPQTEESPSLPKTESQQMPRNSFQQAPPMTLRLHLMRAQQPPLLVLQYH